MADYIDREATIDKLTMLFPLLKRRTIKNILKAVPSADVRPVVTCENCKYSDIFTPNCTEATFPLKCLSIRYGGVYPNWFCEHGEYREGIADG